MATIMVVDDSGFARRVHRKILESAGHEVLEASSGMSALESFFLHHPQLVLLDLSMEDMGGLEVLARMRELDPAARVIVVSADVQRVTGELARSAGAARVLAKPAQAEQLLQAIDAVLSEVTQ